MVDFLHGVPAAVRLLDHLEASGEELATTSVNVAEVWRGAEASDRVSAFLDTLIVLPLDGAAARRAGTLLATLDRAGHPMPELDALIAAVTLENGGRVATRNRRHFGRVAGLHLVRHP